MAMSTPRAVYGQLSRDLQGNLGIDIDTFSISAARRQARKKQHDTNLLERDATKDAALSNLTHPLQEQNRGINHQLLSIDIVHFLPSSVALRLLLVFRQRQARP